MAIPGLVDLGRAEGIASIVLAGEPRLLVVCDDGDRRTGRPSRYLLVRYDQLVIG